MPWSIATMHFASFLSGRGEQYERIDSAAGDDMVSEVDSDRTLLLREAHEFNLNEEQSSEQSKVIPIHRTLVFPRKSVTEQLEGTMKLLIRRMDDTTFVVEVPKKAAILELKGAIEKKFEADGSQISWPHVWGHFCLSFRDQKLLQEHLVLNQLGVGESDELCFVRHLDVRPSKGCQQRGFFNCLRKKHRLSM